MDEMVAYVAQTLPHAHIWHVEHHLVDCPACREAVEQLEEMGIDEFQEGMKGVQEFLDHKRKEFETGTPLSAPETDALEPQAPTSAPHIGGGRRTDDLPDSNRIRRRVSKIVMATATACIALFFFLNILGESQDKPGMLALLRPEGLRLNLLGGEAGRENALQKGIDAFESENWAAAARLFAAIPQSNVDYDPVQIYLAEALVRAKQLPEGIRHFERYLAGKPLHAAHARWYLAAAYFEYEQYEKTKALLEELRSTPNPFQERAEKAYAYLLDLKTSGKLQTEP
ncbi:MAG: hypothetical protein AAF570_00710 [Bacteroidota bacterium]